MEISEPMSAMITGGFIVLDTWWRGIYACWNHREIKVRWPLIWAQVCLYLCLAGLCWENILRAQNLEAAGEHKTHL